MPPRMTGKQRASQIPLDYFRRRGPLENLRLALVVGVPLLAIGWWASGFASGDRGHARYTHGTLAAVHATWDRQCEACHVPFRPINDATIAGKIGDAWGPVSRCESCHRGPAHHANQVPDLSCAGCHHDHRGRDHDLARSPDGDCTRCHENLGAHVAVGKSLAFARDERITHFVDAHPPFRLPEADPGRLKFNHALHLKEGMGQGYAYAKIEDADRDRYLAGRRRADPSASPRSPVTLDCASCHRLERGDSGRSRPDGLPLANTPAASSGTYMIPVTYESDCRGCHALRVEARVPGDPSSRDLDVPHGIQPDEIDRYLWGAYTERYLGRPAPATAAPASRRPGRPVGDRGDERDILAEAVDGATRTLFRDDTAERKVERARNILYLGRQTCAECHAFEKAAVGAMPRVVPPGVPEVWFEHARFDHTAHRAVSCRECHARAYPDAADASSTSGDVLMPSIETCRKCHAPRRESAGAVSGGARFDCVECHRYHNGDERLKGVGAMARDAVAEAAVEQFLRGSFPTAGPAASPSP